jgi:1-acyl-sn-glycerol-3-phosphate acyltransferase
MKGKFGPVETLPGSRPSVLVRIWSVAATALALFYTLIVVGPAAIASLFAQGHYCSSIFRLWAWLIIRTCGISVEIEGMENLEGVKSFVLVSNHQSLIDIMAVLLWIPREMRFLAKREITKIPVLGFALEHSENIVIDRASGGKTIRRALAAVSHGYSICAFAEGHRFSDNQVHEFNEGAAWLAIATKLPCVPMAISGTAAIMPSGARLAQPGRRIRIALRKPISTAGLRRADRAQFTKKLEDEVRNALAGSPEEDGSPTR